MFNIDLKKIAMFLTSLSPLLVDVGCPAISLSGLTVVGGGCNASGWEPGPISDQQSSFPLPGLGNASFGGERDTTLTISDMSWAPGASGPSIGQLVLTRSASGPLATRGGQQSHVELQRQLSYEREASQMRGFLMSGFAAAQPYLPTWQQRREAQASQPADDGVNLKQLAQDLAAQLGPAISEAIRQRLGGGGNPPPQP